MGYLLTFLRFFYPAVNFDCFQEKALKTVGLEQSFKFHSISAQGLH